MGMDTSILDFYGQVTEETESLPKFDEMLFYTGSPNADIVVVSEAPTLPNAPEDHTLYHAVIKEMGDQSPAEVADFLRPYPFREYVDRIVGFCDQPREKIGFTDLCKRPLAEFGRETNLDLEDVWNKTPYSSEEAIRAQLRYVDPRIVVCDKKNVSRLLSRTYLGTDGYSGKGWPDATWDRVGSEEMTLVYSTMAHMQMSLLRRKRLSEEIERLSVRDRDDNN